MKKKDKLYTVNAHNKNLFLFGGDTWENLAKQAGMSVGDYQNSTNAFGLSKANNIFSKGNIGSTFSTLSSTVSPFITKAITGGFNKDTTAGNVISSIGGTVANFLPPGWKEGTQVLTSAFGGFYNRIKGHQENDATKAAVDAVVQQSKDIGNMVSKATSNTALLEAAANNLGTLNISKDGFKDGSIFGFKTNNKGTEAYNNLVAQQDAAQNAFAHNLMTTAQKVDSMNDENVMLNFAAYGGPINRGTMFALGGDIQTNGADFTTGLSRINAGGSHEENPYEGVQVGISKMNGQPNLVEEGETIFDDFVYSKRILIDDETKKKFHISKKAKMSYADLSKKLEKESEERPNDSISKRGLEALMHDLADEQERQKKEEKAKEAKEAFEQLSPEQQAMLMQQSAGNSEVQPLGNINGNVEMPMEQMAAFGGNLFARGARLYRDTTGRLFSQMEDGSYMEASPEEIARVEDNMYKAHTLLKDAKDKKKEEEKDNLLNKQTEFFERMNRKNLGGIHYYSKGGNLFATGGDEENTDVLDEDWYNSLSEHNQALVNALGLKNAEQFMNLPINFRRQLYDILAEAPVNWNNSTFEERNAIEDWEKLDSDLYNSLTALGLDKTKFSDMTPENWQNVYNNYLEGYNKFKAEHPDYNMARYAYRNNPGDRVLWDEEYKKQLEAEELAKKNAPAVEETKVPTTPQEEKELEKLAEAMKNVSSVNDELNAVLKAKQAEASKQAEVPQNAPITESSVPNTVTTDNIQQSLDENDIERIEDTNSDNNLSFTQQKRKAGQYLDRGKYVSAEDIAKYIQEVYSNTESPIEENIESKEYNGITPNSVISDNNGNLYYYIGYSNENPLIYGISTNGGLSYDKEQSLAGEDLSAYGAYIDPKPTNIEDIGSFRLISPGKTKGKIFKSEYDAVNPVDLLNKGKAVGARPLEIKGAGISKNADGTYSYKDPKVNSSSGVQRDLRYAGLMGPIAGLGMMAMGIGKPDYSSLDAALDIASQAPAFASYQPIGNKLTYKPMDIWSEQNRLNANAHATNRAIQNNAGPVGTKMVGLLASDYNNQIASGDLYRKALEYNNALNQQVQDFNRSTDIQNANAFNQTSATNAGILNSHRQNRAQMAYNNALAKMESQAGWYNSLYGNINSFFKGIGDIGTDNFNKDTVAAMFIDSFGDTNKSETAKRLGAAKGNNVTANGGKISRRKKKRFNNLRRRNNAKL